MSEPTSTEKTTKKAATTKSEAAGKAAKVTKAKAAKREKPAREDVCVFAFRLSEADRETIHKAAGPAKASRFVLAAALAAATGDTKAFETLVAQARSNTK